MYNYMQNLIVYIIKFISYNYIVYDITYVTLYIILFNFYIIYI